MRLRESIDIAADARTMWPFVADPELQRLWNSKVVSVHRQQSGSVVPGERFEMVYCMSRQQRQSRVEVRTCEPLHRLTFEHRMCWNGQEHVAQEDYQILEKQGGVQVVQTTDLSRVGAAWPLRLLIWLIFRFGKKVEKPRLERLKRAVEKQSVLV